MLWLSWCARVQTPLMIVDAVVPVSADAMTWMIVICWQSKVLPPRISRVQPRATSAYIVGVWSVETISDPCPAHCWLDDCHCWWRHFKNYKNCFQYFPHLSHFFWPSDRSSSRESVQSCHLQGRSGTAICLGLKLKRSATGQSGLGREWMVKPCLKPAHWNGKRIKSYKYHVGPRPIVNQNGTSQQLGN